tara:strand:+ start:27886 stop:29835 length:1950 start_codon:yes stop_codon:yes gene_type:complete
MQTSATNILENIIRQELSLLQEQDEKTINLYLDRLKIDYPVMYKQLFDKQPKVLDNKSMRAAVYKELSTSSDADIKNVYQSITDKIPKPFNPNWPVNVSAGGNVLSWPGIEKDLKLGITPNFGPYGGKAGFIKAYPAAAQYLKGGLKYKSPAQRSKDLGKPTTPELAIQLKYYKTADAIIKTRGTFSDDETAALNLINSIKTQDEYYYINQRVCDWMRKTGMSAWGYSLPKFLKTFSGKSIVDVDEPFTTALRSFGYMSAVGKSTQDGNRKGLKNYILPVQQIARLKLEIEWWKKLEKKLNALEALDRDKWQSLKYNVYDPLYTHNIQIETIIDSLSLAKTETQTALEQEKEKQKMIGGQPAIVRWFKETLDENPAEVLSTMAMVASFASGPAALLFTLGLGGAATGLYFEQGAFAEGGTEAIFTIILTLSGVRRLQSVAKIGQAGRVKLAEALAKSDIRFLNEFERIAFADISNYIAKNSTAVKNGIKSKLQNFINSTGEKVLRQRIVNQLRNQRLTPYKNVVSAIYNDIKNGVIFDVAWWTGKGTRAVLKYGPPGLEIVAYTQAPSGAGYWNDIYDDTKITVEWQGQDIEVTAKEYENMIRDTKRVEQITNGTWTIDPSVDIEEIKNLDFSDSTSNNPFADAENIFN